MEKEQSSEFIFHTRNDVFDVVSDLNERWENRLTFDNPRLAERYVEGKLR